MRSAPNFGDLLLDRRPSHFVPPEMRERMLLALPSASGSGPVSFARRVRTPTTWPAVHLTRWSKCHACAVSTDDASMACHFSHSYRELRPSICHGDAPTTTTRL